MSGGKGKQAGKAKAFVADIGEIAKALRERIEAECDGFAPDPVAAKARAARAKDDFRFFAETYFPHHVRGAPSEFHLWLYETLPGVVAAADGRRWAIAAPRGNAKTTFCSQIFVLWCVITARKRYPVLLSDATDQAAAVLEGIKAELEVNRRLAMDFPSAVGVGPVWQQGCIVTKNGAKLEAFGASRRLRGRRHGALRPDLVICDDLENDENVRTPAQRDKLESWIDKAVEPLGPPDGSMDLIYVGTILHYDAVLSRKIKNQMWRSKVFKALVNPPDRPDLWELWEEIARNEGEEAADAFRAANAAAMDAGAAVLWPAVQPLPALMKIRLRIGTDAFNCEYQNDPIDAAAALFGNIQFWVQPVRHWVFFGACDPSLGGGGAKSDPSAILIGGLDRDSGILDVIAADIAKRTPDRIIEDIIRLQAEYRCLRWGIEIVQFQAFLASELVLRSAKRGFPVPAVGLTSAFSKEMRIESIQPHVANGLIRLKPGLSELETQLRHYPKADHDDGPDALEMLWRVAVSARAGAPVLVAPRARSATGDFIGGGAVYGVMGYHGFIGG
jgi:predicted phage terminase large subunit-like protein